MVLGSGHSVVFAVFAAFAIGACSESAQTAPRVLVVDESRSDVAIVGVPPDSFACESVAPPHAVQEIIGPFRVLSSQFEPPPGLAKPCTYLIPTDAGAIQWSFDIDCRENALEDGKALMVQYTKQASSTQGGLIAEPVRVGASGIDYNDAALLFIDDDSPCYGRVLGPGADARRKLAELVAANLTPSTAPTSSKYERRAETQNEP